MPRSVHERDRGADRTRLPDDGRRAAGEPRRAARAAGGRFKLHGHSSDRLTAKDAKESKRQDQSLVFSSLSCLAFFALLALKVVNGRLITRAIRSPRVRARR